MIEPSEICVRQALESDLPALEWEGEYRHFRNLYRQAMRESQKGRRILLVAELDGRVIGQLFIQLEGPSKGRRGKNREGYLYSFRVRERFRNQGIGTRLVRTAESILHDQGFQRVQIAVAKENSDARRLYERLGYAVCREDPGRWSYFDDQNRLRTVDEPSFIMQKSLG